MESHPHTMPEGHPHGPMRRDDRLITEPDLLTDILKQGHLMHLALSDNNVPFLVPLFYAYDGTALYFHSAKAGTKIEILQRNPLVCFEISDYQGVISSDMACNFEARHRTVIGLGRASFIQSQEEKVRILDLIVARFSQQTFSYPQANLTATTVVRIDIASMKGKQHGQA